MESRTSRKVQKVSFGGQITSRNITVSFAESKLLKEFNRLRGEDPQLFKFLDRALDDIKLNPECGIPIQKRLIPKIYIQKYGINNLWKYNLPNAWRLLYSLAGNRVEIVAVVLEWMKHDEYERRFKY